MAYRRRYRPSDWPRSSPDRRIPLAWYAPEDYPRMLGIILDRGVLPASYDQWRENAEHDKRKWQGRDVTVVPIPVDPELFLAFCAGHELEPGVDALKRFVQALVAPELYQP